MSFEVRCAKGRLRQPAGMAESPELPDMQLHNNLGIYLSHLHVVFCALHSG